VALGDCLNHNNSLEDLDISGNNFDFEGMQKLAEALKLNTSLKHLNISRNAI